MEVDDAVTGDKRGLDGLGECERKIRLSIIREKTHQRLTVSGSDNKEHANGLCPQMNTAL